MTLPLNSTLESRVDGSLDDAVPGPGTLQARSVHAWFGRRPAVEDIDLTIPGRSVTAVIGPSGCGKSTFLRVLNRMHELVPGASVGGGVLLDGIDIYDPGVRATQTRLRIGMVFQRPNPFPNMSVRANVLSGLRLAGLHPARAAGRSQQRAALEDLTESCLERAGLWREVRNRLDDPAWGLSGGQAQRLCIARSLAVGPQVLLMDEPCSALDPASTRRVEETISQIAREVTVVIVTHNLAQALRVADRAAFFLAEEESPGRLIEEGPTARLFDQPADERTADYLQGRFG